MGMAQGGEEVGTRALALQLLVGRGIPSECHGLAELMGGRKPCLSSLVLLTPPCLSSVIRPQSPGF